MDPFLFSESTLVIRGPKLSSPKLEHHLVLFLLSQFVLKCIQYYLDVPRGCFFLAF
jgi:hypothetical protein